MINSTQRLTIPTEKIIQESVKFCLNNYDALFPPFLLINIVESFLWKIAFDIIPPFEIQPGFTENFLVNLIQYLTSVIPLIILFALACWIIDTIPNGLAIKYSSERIEGRSISLLRSFKAVSLKIPRLMLLGLVSGVLIILGFVLLIFPGVIMTMIFSLAIQAMVIERLGVYESLKRSKKLVLKKPWQVLLILLFLLTLTLMAAFLGESICTHLMIDKVYLRLAVMLIVVSMVKPLQPVVLTYLYYSLSDKHKLLEARKERLPPAPILYQKEEMWTVKYHPNFCYKCGQRLPSDALYCPRCGVRVRP